MTLFFLYPLIHSFSLDSDKHPSVEKHLSLVSLGFPSAEVDGQCDRVCFRCEQTDFSQITRLSFFCFHSSDECDTS